MPHSLTKHILVYIVFTGYTVLFSHHTHLYTDGHVGKQHGSQCLTQGRFDMWPKEAGNETTNHSIGRRLNYSCVFLHHCKPLQRFGFFQRFVLFFTTHLLHPFITSTPSNRSKFCTK